MNSYDDTFEDAPEQEIKCPHCGAIWGLHTINPDGVFDHHLYDWTTQDGKSSCCTRDSSKTPVTKDFCYACAYETATHEDLKDYIDDTQIWADGFREWRIGF